MVQSEFVTTRDVAAAAKFTLPLVLLIVCAPVVPPAVIVLDGLNPPTISVPTPVLPSVTRTTPAESLARPLS